MISRRLLLAIALLAPLVACDGGGDPPFCSAEATSPTADTLIGGVVDGRPVLVPTAGGYGGAFHDTTAGWLIVTGQIVDTTPQQRFQVMIFGFHGTGVYPAQLQQSPGAANAFYWCQDITDQAYEAQGTPGDQVTVASYDSLTGEISGTFAFHGFGWRHGDTFLITNGAFHAFAVKQ